jgi:uncharacterized protein HemX
MAVTAVVAAVAVGSAVYSGHEADKSRKEAKHDAKRQEFVQNENQRKVREEEDRTQSQRAMLANRQRQRAMSSWSSPTQSLGGGAADAGSANKNLLGL